MGLKLFIHFPFDFARALPSPHLLGSKDLMQQRGQSQFASGVMGPRQSHSFSGSSVLEEQISPSA